MACLGRAENSRHHGARDLFRKRGPEARRIIPRRPNSGKAPPSRRSSQRARAKTAVRGMGMETRRPTAATLAR